MIKLGLERVQSTLSAMGDPHHKFHAVHVAGTNGKGSTCALLESALVACLRPSGQLVGKFVSPYLLEPRDAVSIDGAPLSQAAWQAALGEVAQCAPPEATPFERWTCAAFQAFAAAGVAVAVVEVGVGGGGDATNVLPTPLLALVTPIAMDHVDLLGPALADIAGHKAGILKAPRGQGSPCRGLSAPSQHPEVLAVLQARAASVGLPFAVAPLLPWHARGVLLAAQGGAGPAAPPALLPLGLPGDFQATNASLAWAALQSLGASHWPALLDAAAVGAAWAAVQWRGRAETVQLRLTPGSAAATATAATAATAAGAATATPASTLDLTFTLDGAHNVHAMGALAEEVAWRCGQAGGGRLALVCACGASRDAGELLGVLLGGLWQRQPALRITLYAVPYAVPQGMPWAAPYSPQALAAAAEGVAQRLLAEGALAGAGQCRVLAAESLGEALGAVAGDGELSAASTCRVLCGSLYLMSDVARLCQFV